MGSLKVLIKRGWKDGQMKKESLDMKLSFLCDPDKITFGFHLGSRLTIESPLLSQWFFIFLQAQKAASFWLTEKQKNPSASRRMDFLL